MDKLVSIDERMLGDAMHLSGLESVDNVVQLGLTMFINIRLSKQGLIRKYMGALKWDADINPLETARETIRAVS